MATTDQNKQLIIRIIIFTVIFVIGLVLLIVGMRNVYSPNRVVYYQSPPPVMLRT